MDEMNANAESDMLGSPTWHMIKTPKMDKNIINNIKSYLWVLI